MQEQTFKVRITVEFYTGAQTPDEACDNAYRILSEAGVADGEVVAVATAVETHCGFVEFEKPTMKRY